MSIVQTYLKNKIAFYIRQKYIGKESTKEIEHLFLTANAQRQYLSLFRCLVLFFRRPKTVAYYKSLTSKLKIKLSLWK